MNRISRAAIERIASGTVTAFIVRTSPALAEEFLKNNKGNRALRLRHAQSLGRSMTAGNWQLTHQGICFASDGTLIDGQHRLRAIIESGVTIPLLVFVEWDVGAFHMLDIGMKRNLRDVLRQDARVLDVASALRRLSCGMLSDASVPHEVQEMIDVFESDIAAVLEAAGHAAAKRTVSGIRAAVVLRHRLAAGEDRRYILNQWRAWVLADWPAASHSVARLARRIESIGSVGRARQSEEAAVAWIAFDPAQRELQRIVVRDASHEIDQMRAAIASIVGSPTTAIRP